MDTHYNKQSDWLLNIENKFIEIGGGKIRAFPHRPTTLKIKHCFIFQKINQYFKNEILLSFSKNKANTLIHNGLNHALF